MQLRINHYAELSKYVDIFMSGALDVMIIEGTPGNGKSSMTKQKLTAAGKVEEKDYLWLEGRLTAAAFYDRLFNHRDLPVIIDDVDGLYANKESVNILKCLCQTEIEKKISWNTVSKLRVAQASFVTKSKVCIITNSWKSLNKHVGAVEDRGLLILFRPDANEIHTYTKETLGKNPDVFNEEVGEFIGKNLGIIKEPSIRHYRNALQLKNANADWKSVLIESFGLTDNEMLVMKLCQIKTLSHNQRAAAFAEELKKSERTYWRVKSDLEAHGIDLT